MKIYRKADYFKPIDECSREVEEGFDASEYHTMIAISRMPDEFTDAQLSHEMAKVLADAEIDKLVQAGLIDAIWDEAQGAVVYRIKQ